MDHIHDGQPGCLVVFDTVVEGFEMRKIRLYVRKAPVVSVSCFCGFPGVRTTTARTRRRFVR